jgi:hypothetical protein
MLLKNGTHVTFINKVGGNSSNPVWRKTLSFIYYNNKKKIKKEGRANPSFTPHNVEYPKQVSSIWTQLSLFESTVFKCFLDVLITVTTRKEDVKKKKKKKKKKKNKKKGKESLSRYNE